MSLNICRRGVGFEKFPRVPRRNSRVESTHLAPITAELLFPPHISDWVRDSNKTINSDFRSPPPFFFFLHSETLTKKTWGLRPCGEFSRQSETLKKRKTSRASAFRPNLEGVKHFQMAAGNYCRVCRLLFLNSPPLPPMAFHPPGSAQGNTQPPVKPAVYLLHLFILRFFFVWVQKYEVLFLFWHGRSRNGPGHTTPCHCLEDRKPRWTTGALRPPAPHLPPLRYFSI